MLLMLTTFVSKSTHYIFKMVLHRAGCGDDLLQFLKSLSIYTDFKNIYAAHRSSPGRSQTFITLSQNAKTTHFLTNYTATDQDQ